MKRLHHYPRFSSIHPSSLPHFFAYLLPFSSILTSLARSLLSYVRQTSPHAREENKRTQTREHTILLRDPLIYSPLEVDDFRYFSSAVSSKQLPFPNVHPAPPLFRDTFLRPWISNRGHRSEGCSVASKMRPSDRISRGKSMGETGKFIVEIATSIDPKRW